ncbi:MAG: hypothetical protein GY757_02755 [bacterium]|nr:hypothetical protein [bacterium]
MHKVPFPKQEGDRYFEINRAILAVIQDTATIDNQSTRNILVIKKELPLHYYKAINELGMTIVELEAQLQELRKRGIEPHYWRGTNKMGHWNHEAQDLIGNYLATLLTTDPGAEKETKQPKRGERELN